MKNGFLMLIIGSSGSGKNTIINQLTNTNPKVKFLVSNTTREMREGERNGVTYNFVTKQEFEKAIERNEMLEYDITHKGYYGISKKTITDTIKGDNIIVKDISIMGLFNCRSQLSNTTDIVSIFLTESKKVLKQRLILRGEKNYKLRLKIYSKEQAQMNNCDYIIKNSNLSHTLQKIEALVAHKTKKQPFGLLENFKAVNLKKVQKLVKALNNGHKIKEVKIELIDGNIYVVKNANHYLAGLISGKVVSKRFVQDHKVKSGLKLEQNNQKWLEVIKELNGSLKN